MRIDIVTERHCSPWMYNVCKMVSNLINCQLYIFIIKQRFMGTYVLLGTVLINDLRKTLTYVHI